MAYVRDNWRRLAWWAPVPVAGVYAIALLVTFRSIIGAINRNSDVSIALVMGKLWGEAPPGSTVQLGNHAWYEELLFLRATSEFPLYRELWAVTPFLLVAAALALLLWSIHRLFGLWPAVIAGAALVCVGHHGRFMFFSFNWHGFAAIHLAVVGVALVWAVTRAKPWRTGPLLAFSLLIGVVSALAMGSDPAFRYWLLGPLAATAAAAAWRLRGSARRVVLIFSVVVAAVSVVGGAILISLMEDRGVLASEPNTTFAAVDRIVPNLELLVQGFTALAGGAFFGAKPDVTGLATLASGVLALVALYFALRATRQWVHSAVLAEGDIGRDDRDDAARLVYVAFWSVLLIVTLLAFVLSSIPVDIMSSRFLLPGYVAVGALLPLIALRGVGARAALTAAVTLFALTGTYNLIRDPAESGGPFPSGPAANALRDFAEENDVAFGYSDYWVASDLTWLTDFDVELYPVLTCGAELCRHHVGQISSWYTERPDERSLLVVDDNWPGLQHPSPELGEPIATERFGSMTMYAYEHDLARGIQ